MATRTFLLLIAWALWIPSVQADLVTVLNPSFESPVAPDGGFAPSIDSWFIAGSAGVFNPLAGVHYSGPGTTDGLQTAFGNQGGFMAQILSDNLFADRRYTLQVDVGDRLDLVFADYSVGLYAGGNLLAQDVASLTPDDGFLTSTVSYTALTDDPLLGQPLEIRLGVGFGGQQVNFDNVRLTSSPIPEVSGQALCALGLLVLLGWKFRSVSVPGGHSSPDGAPPGPLSAGA